MSESHSSPAPRFRLQLMDLAALVVGYGMAAVLFRAFWPRGEVSSGILGFAIGFYVWLGLAMSGPLLLLRHRTAVNPGEQSPRSSESQPRTWAELAWLVIGVYWFVMGVFILPIRLHNFRVTDTLLFGLAPLAAGLLLRAFGSRAFPENPAAAWTHQAAVGAAAHLAGRLVVPDRHGPDSALADGNPDLESTQPVSSSRSISGR